MTTTVTERPILFSGPMVRAILAGQKTQTRRVLMASRGRAWREQDARAANLDFNRREISFEYARGASWSGPISFPYGQPGDRLWVRETWRTEERESDLVDGVRFCADGAFKPIDDSPAAVDAWLSAHRPGIGVRIKPGRRFDWRPSIHMPRWASRITLEITDVRVERLQDITPADAVAEGAEKHWTDQGYAPTPSEVNSYQGYARWSFALAWNEINGKRGYLWATNPWVWVITFKVAA